MSTNGKDVQSQQEEEELSQPESRPNVNVPKTPVSLLQELYVRKGITPKYDLVQIEGAVHEPTFKYRVTVGDAVATGSGASKKKAKHEAAKNILTKLKAAQKNREKVGNAAETMGFDAAGEAESDGVKADLMASAAAAVRDVELPNLDTDLVSPYDDGIEGNPVGELQEMCMNRRMQPPAYEVSLEEGAPHERNFVITCVVNNKFRESGCGKSKKLAKRKAAAKMMMTLKGQPVIVDDNDPALGGTVMIDDDELAQGIAQRNALLKAGGQNASSHAQQLLNMTKLYRHLKANAGTKLAQLQDDNFVTPEDPVEYLEDLGEEQDFTVTYVDVDEKSKSDRYHCFVQLAANPVAVCFGIGDETRQDARKDAAKNALEYLRIVTK